MPRSSVAPARSRARSKTKGTTKRSRQVTPKPKPTKVLINTVGKPRKKRTVTGPAARDSNDQAKFETLPPEAPKQSVDQAPQMPPEVQPHDTVPSKAVGVILRAMNWAYDTASHAGLGFDSASDMAAKYRARSKSADEAIDSLIRWHVLYAGASGFVANLGGLVTLPIAIPADLASVLLLQLRMVAAIAHIRGYESTDPHVRTLAFICLAGNSGAEILKEFSINLGTKLAQRGIAQLSGATLIRINQAVGFRLVTKAGTTGLINLSKWVPLFGGLVGGGVDAAVTRGVGAMAKKAFRPLDETSEN